ncbi:MAG: hypothetical protein E6G62_10690, partial [Actinobacteria bacterium]
MSVPDVAPMVVASVFASTPHAKEWPLTVKFPPPALTVTICTGPAVEPSPGRTTAALIVCPPWWSVEESTRGPDWNCAGARVSDELGLRLIPNVACAMRFASGMMSPVVWTLARPLRLAPKSRLKPPATAIAS